MALSPELETFVQDLFDMYQARKTMTDLHNQRHVEEEQLVTDYKIEESNVKRREIAARYTDLIRPVQQQIADIEARMNAR